MRLRSGPSSSSSHPYSQRTVRYQLDTSNISRNHMNNAILPTPYPSVVASLYQILSSLAIFIFILLCTFGLVTTLFILYLTIRPFSVPTYRRLACNIGSSALIDAMALLLPNMRIYLTGDSDPLSPVGVSVLVCNHVMEGDWWAILMLARCVGLRGSVKPFLQPQPNTNNNVEKSSSPTNSHHNNTAVGGTNVFASNSVGDNYQEQYGASSNSNTIINNTNIINNTKASTNIAMSASAPLLNKSASLSSNLGFMKRVLSHQGVVGGGNGNVSGNGKNNDSSPRLNEPNTNMTITATSSTITGGLSGTTTGTSATHSVPRSNSPTTPSSNKSSTNNNTTKPTSLIFRFLHTLLEFPMLSSEHTQNYIADRDELFSLLRNFASHGAPAPVHLLLFPEGWPEGDDRKSMMTKSMEFAKREGRPQLQHLLLPRTTGFYASLDSLREASPVVYDITIAYRGYDGGERPFSCDINLRTIMKLIRGEIPNEVHIRIKRYSMEEVLSDAQWLDKLWSEKDRLLGKFVRFGNFANVDNRGFCRYRVLDSRGHSVESSITAILRLGLIPFAIPVIVILFIPLLWGVAWVWLAHRSFLLFFPGGINELIGAANMGGNGYRYGRNVNMNKEQGSGNQDDVSNGGTDSVAGTPFFFPATPFASPTLCRWD